MLQQPSMKSTGVNGISKKNQIKNLSPFCSRPGEYKSCRIWIQNPENRVAWLLEPDFTRKRSLAPDARVTQQAISYCARAKNKVGVERTNLHFSLSAQRKLQSNLLSHVFVLCLLHNSKVAYSSTLFFLSFAFALALMFVTHHVFSPHV